MPRLSEQNEIERGFKRHCGAQGAQVQLNIRAMLSAVFLGTDLDAWASSCVEMVLNEGARLVLQIVDLQPGANGKFKCQFTDGKENIQGILTSQVRAGSQF